MFESSHSNPEYTTQSCISKWIIPEAVVNALIHRDYSIVGAKCQIAINENTITIKSPGAPPHPITVEQLQNFTAPMLSRNPELHYVFARMGMAEEQGLGIRSLRDKARELKLPLPVYAWDAPYIVLTLYRSEEGAVRALPSKLLEAMNKEETRGWKYLSSKKTCTRAEYEEYMKINKRKAQRHFKKFVSIGLLRKFGSSSATTYQILHK